MLGVELEFFLFCHPASPGYLRRPRKTRFYKQPLSLPPVPLRFLREIHRPRADYTHISSNYTKQLQRFVKEILVEELSRSCQLSGRIGCRTWAEWACIGPNCPKFLKYERFSASTRLYCQKMGGLREQSAPSSNHRRHRTARCKEKSEKFCYRLENWSTIIIQALCRVYTRFLRKYAHKPLLL